MAHSLGPITSASATACSKDSPCFLLQPRNQAYRRHGHDHAPPALFRAAASLQQNHRRTTHTAANRAICSRSQRHSVRSFLACPQRRGCQIDQIAIGRTRGPRFRATKVSATPPTFSARPQPRRGVAETSPFREWRQRPLLAPSCHGRMRQNIRWRKRTPHPSQTILLAEGTMPGCPPRPEGVRSAGSRLLIAVHLPSGTAQAYVRAWA